MTGQFGSTNFHPRFSTDWYEKKKKITFLIAIFFNTTFAAIQAVM